MLGTFNMGSLNPTDDAAQTLAGEAYAEGDERADAVDWFADQGAEIVNAEIVDQIVIAYRTTSRWETAIDDIVNGDRTAS